MSSLGAGVDQLDCVRIREGRLDQGYRLLWIRSFLQPGCLYKALERKKHTFLPQNNVELKAPARQENSEAHCLQEAELAFINNTTGLSLAMSSCWVKGEAAAIRTVMECLDGCHLNVARTLSSPSPLPLPPVLFPLSNTAPAEPSPPNHFSA